MSTNLLLPSFLEARLRAFRARLFRRLDSLSTPPFLSRPFSAVMDQSDVVTDFSNFPFSRHPREQPALPSISLWSRPDGPFRRHGAHPFGLSFFFQYGPIMFSRHFFIAEQTPFQPSYTLSWPPLDVTISGPRFRITPFLLFFYSSRVPHPSAALLPRALVFLPRGF